MEIRQPLPAIVSVLHRISGALLFFPGIPLILFALEGLLSSPHNYAQAQSVFAHPLFKVGFILALWLFLHHLLAGIRFLGLDLHYAIEIHQARLTSKLVLAAGIVLTLLIGIAIW